MEGVNADPQLPYDAGQASEAPPIDNIHQTLDNSGGGPYQSTPPAHANVCL